MNMENNLPQIESTGDETVRVAGSSADDESLSVEPQTVSEPPAPVQLEDRMLIALRAAEEKKAIDPVVLDLRPVASFTEFFFIMGGSNTRQVQAIADEIEARMKRAGDRQVRIEGYGTAEWILLDYGDFVVHVFEAKARSFFDLERLWRDAPRVSVTPEMLAAVAAADEPGGNA